MTLTTPPSTPDLATGPAAALRLGSLAWQGTRLDAVGIQTAVGHVIDDLAARGVVPGSTVVLESDDSGRTVLGLLALAGMDCSVVLTDRLGRAFDEPATDRKSVV